MEGYIQHNLEQVRQRMQQAAARAGRNVQTVQLIAVSKMADVSAIQQAFDLGMRDFGENRSPQLKTRQLLWPQADWHMIGRLQTNKVKEAVEHACMIHSVDRFALAEEIDRRAEKLGKIMPCLLQVNIAEEPQKAGIQEMEAADFLAAAQELKHIRFQGLMTMAPDVPPQELESVRPVFRKLRRTAEKLRVVSWKNSEMKELSMGMSNDFEIAIEEGATMIRVGSAVYQNREK